jgi:heme-degrading monooxygenase HmoA
LISRKGRKKEIIDYWEEVAQLMKKAPGYISTALHQAIDENARFHLINWAEWESAESFYAAVQTPDFKAIAARNKGKYQYFPGLYEIIRTDDDLK